MWLSKTSKFRVQYSELYPPAFDAAGRRDFAWWLRRSGFVSMSGQLLYGYGN
jgi:hypothetical protein